MRCSSNCCVLRLPPNNYFRGFALVRRSVVKSIEKRSASVAANPDSRQSPFAGLSSRKRNPTERAGTLNQSRSVAVGRSGGDCQAEIARNPALPGIGELRACADGRKSVLLRGVCFGAARRGDHFNRTGRRSAQRWSLNSAKLVVPASLESVIVARVDVLRPEEQLLLKASSAVGGPLTPELLQSAYPVGIALDDIRAMLESFVARELRVVTTSPGLAYEFRHALIEEVTYGLLSLAQRRLLHAAIAKTLESDHAGRTGRSTGSLPGIGSAPATRSGRSSYLQS